MRCKITLVCAILQVFRGFFYFYHLIKDNCAWGIYANYRELPVNNQTTGTTRNQLAQRWGRLRFIQCTIALDTGWVACGEKLNRSLCSLKIKLFLDAGGVDCGLFNAQLR